MLVGLKKLGERVWVRRWWK